MTLTAEQIEARRAGIGGSDAAAVCGLSRWKSPMDVYLDKIGALPDLEESEAMYWGSKLESAVAARFAEDHPEFVVVPDLGSFTHVKHKFMKALPDALLMEADSPGDYTVGLEIKTASAFKAKEWGEDEVPIEYLIQCQHYMAVLDLPKWYLAVLIGGQTYREYEVERDDELIATLIEREAAFWKLVQDKTPPAIDGSKASGEVLKFLYPADAVIEEALTLPERIDFDGKDTSTEDLATVRIQIKAEIADAEKRLALIDNTFKALLGEHERGFAGAFEVTWKPVTSTRVDSKRLQKEHPEVYAECSKTSSYRKFDIKEG